MPKKKTKKITKKKPTKKKSQKKVKLIPDGYHSLTPYLVVHDGAKAIEFYKKAFGAKEVIKPFMGPDGKVGHAELQIGDSRFMLSDENPAMGNRSPKTLGGSPIGLAFYVEDADSVFKKALAHGAKEKRPMNDQFYGDRSGQVEDPFGHTWTIGTHIEDVSEEEMQRRAQKLFGAGSSPKNSAQN